MVWQRIAASTRGLLSALRRLSVGSTATAVVPLRHESDPCAASSTALRHLSAEQALADAAQFVEWWSASHSSPDSAWVAWGGSYIQRAAGGVAAAASRSSARAAVDVNGA